MSEELLPCPFCGESNAIICETDYEGNTELVPAYAVSCRTKRCAAGIWSLAMGHFDTKQKAIKAWNTRTEKKWKYAKAPSFINSREIDDLDSIKEIELIAEGFNAAREKQP